MTRGPGVRLCTVQALLARFVVLPLGLSAKPVGVLLLRPHIICPPQGQICLCRLYQVVLHLGWTQRTILGKKDAVLSQRPLSCITQPRLKSC